MTQTQSLKETSNEQKPVKINRSGGLKAFLSKISGAFMLPISVMALAGLFLGVGATLASQYKVGDIHVIGLFIKNMGDPVFGAMPILFAAAIVVAFTEEAGVGVFAAVIGYLIFSAIQMPFITEHHDTVTAMPKHDGWIWHAATKEKEAYWTKTTGYTILFDGAGRNPKNMLSLIGTNLGIKSLQTSVFGGILVGAITALLYNRFHTIKLPNIIAFFGGKRFVALITMLMMIPLAFVFLAVWPWAGYGLSWFGNHSGKLPYGTDSLVFGYIERALIPFGLHHVFYAPLWWTSAGGNFNDTFETWSKAGNHFTGAAANAKTGLEAVMNGTAGDQKMWVAASGLTFDNVTWADKGGKAHSLAVFTFFQDELHLKLARFMQGKYSFMDFGLPAATVAMVLAAPRENRRVAMGTVFPAALTAFLTGVTEPIEFTFLFLAPWLFWGFHAIMAGISFMLMNILGAHVGMTFSGGMMDMVIYGIMPMDKGTHFWWAFIIGSALIPIYFVVFYYSIKKFNLETPGRGSNTKLFTKKDFQAKNSNTKGDAQTQAIIAAYGGSENIVRTANCATRLRFDVRDSSLVDVDALKATGAFGVMKTSKTHVQAIYGPQAEQLHVAIKEELKNK